MKEPKYPQTPRRNCLYCFHYNAKANACDNPKMGINIISFNSNDDKDCPLLRWEKTENPVAPENNFKQTFCIGKKCPYFYAKSQLCTRPSLCPYKGEEPTVFDSIRLKT